MIENFYTRPLMIARLQSGLLGPYLAPLADALYQQGYSGETIRSYLYAWDKFCQWLTQRGHSVGDMSTELVEDYVSALGYTPAGHRPKASHGLRHLVTFLEQQGVIANRRRATPTTEAERWLARYEAYLDDMAGITASSRQRYRAPIRRFLEAQFGDGPVNWASLSVQAIATFIREEATIRAGFGRKAPAVAVRSLLRFLVSQGELG